MGGLSEALEAGPRACNSGPAPKARPGNRRFKARESEIQGPGIGDSRPGNRRFTARESEVHGPDEGERKKRLLCRPLSSCVMKDTELEKVLNWVLKLTRAKEATPVSPPLLRLAGQEAPVLDHNKRALTELLARVAGR